MRRCFINRKHVSFHRSFEFSEFCVWAA